MYTIDHSYSGPLFRNGYILGMRTPVTFIEVEAISWENPPKWQELPVLPSVHAYCYSSKSTKAHDPMAKYVSVSSENLHEVQIN